MNNFWLTIITITKDDPVGLGRTLASAHRMRAAGAQHLVIDGSTVAANAGGGPVPQGQGCEIRAQPPRGISVAFNAGLAEARGEWIWFLNGGDRVDDRLTPEFLSGLLNSTRAEMVIGAITYEGEAEPRPHPPEELQWPPFRSWIPHPSTLVRRRLFEQFGGFDECYTIAMDYEWWLRALGPTVSVDVVSVPLAIFASGGISQRPEMRNIIRREKRHALWRHQSKLWRPWCLANYLLARAWFLSLLSHRLGEKRRLP